MATQTVKQFLRTHDNDVVDLFTKLTNPVSTELFESVRHQPDLDNSVFIDYKIALDLLRLSNDIFDNKVYVRTDTPPPPPPPSIPASLSSKIATLENMVRRINDNSRYKEPLELILKRLMIEHEISNIETLVKQFLDMYKLYRVDESELNQLFNELTTIELTQPIPDANTVKVYPSQKQASNMGSIITTPEINMRPTSPPALSTLPVTVSTSHSALPTSASAIPTLPVTPSTLPVTVSTLPPEPLTLPPVPPTLPPVPPPLPAESTLPTPPTQSSGSFLPPPPPPPPPPPMNDNIILPLVSPPPPAMDNDIISPLVNVETVPQPISSSTPKKKTTPPPEEDLSAQILRVSKARLARLSENNATPVIKSKPPVTKTKPQALTLRNKKAVQEVQQPIRATSIADIFKKSFENDSFRDDITARRTSHAPSSSDNNANENSEDWLAEPEDIADYKNQFNVYQKKIAGFPMEIPANIQALSKTITDTLNKSQHTTNDRDTIQKLLYELATAINKATSI
uniref:Orf1629 n=1 Tax=Mamestra configurata nucleopolyhedrovirus B TaxID=204440 RepID=A0A7G7Y8F6_9ABAC|nr:orf1629 [Mamestra configurata nucleopolyhedrovirus B]